MEYDDIESKATEIIDNVKERIIAEYIQWDAGQGPDPRAYQIRITAVQGDRITYQLRTGSDCPSFNRAKVNSLTGKCTYIPIMQSCTYDLEARNEIAANPTDNDRVWLALTKHDPLTQKEIDENIIWFMRAGGLSC